MAYTEAHAVGYLMLAHPLRCPMAASHLSLPLSHVDLDKRGTAKGRQNAPNYAVAGLICRTPSRGAVIYLAALSRAYSSHVTAQTNGNMWQNGHQR